ncbi:hypothetical protein [Aliamphritea spongicola]|nr:hypothetical protein [Aliamphritea spongicola]
MFDFLRTGQRAESAGAALATPVSEGGADNGVAPAFAGAYTQLSSLIGLQQYSSQMSLLSAPRRAAQLSGNWQTRIRGRGWTSRKCASISPAMISAVWTGG